MFFITSWAVLEFYLVMIKFINQESNFSLRPIPGAWAGSSRAR